ncbi:hypothetical protein D1823_00465 [Ruegeria sp. AD91A]|nr:hypothetical protein D1823_00465 [Ruegeria sp. AD91A]
MTEGSPDALTLIQGVIGRVLFEYRPSAFDLRILTTIGRVHSFGTAFFLELFLRPARNRKGALNHKRALVIGKKLKTCVLNRT